MTVIATDVQRLGNVLKHEYEPASGFCHEAVDVTVVSGMKVGAVLTTAGALVAVATTANTAYVLVDPRVTNLAPGVHKLDCIARGPAIFAREALSFGADIDTGAEIDAVVAVLATKNILVSEQK